MPKGVIKLKNLKFYENTIATLCEEIDILRNLLYLSSYIPDKLNYEKSILQNMNLITKLLINYNKLTLKRQNEKVFTLDELSNFDGSKGKPAYIAVNGIVYDVSYEPSWGGGTHFGQYAGQDLTEEYKACHSDSTVLNKLNIVGVLKRSR